MRGESVWIIMGEKSTKEKGARWRVESLTKEGFHGFESRKGGFGKERRAKREFCKGLGFRGGELGLKKKKKVERILDR